MQRRLAHLPHARTKRRAVLRIEPEVQAKAALRLPLGRSRKMCRAKLVEENLHRRITREVSLIKAENDEPYLLLQVALEDAPSMSCPHTITFTVGDN